MKSKFSEWNNNTKILTIVFGFIAFINIILALFIKINIPGLLPISLGIFLFGLGLRELDLFKENRKKFRLTLGTTFLTMFAIHFCFGIIQIENYILSLS